MGGHRLFGWPAAAVGSIALDPIKVHVRESAWRCRRRTKWAASEYAANSLSLKQDTVYPKMINESLEPVKPKSGCCHGSGANSKTAAGKRIDCWESITSNDAEQ
eukprot:scaffold446131_cov35-Prasinocladus_malaysianus.AAC.2